MTYSISEHRHRYSAWAASRAASTITCRFEVKEGKEILEAVGLQWKISHPDALPKPAEVDVVHRHWRELAIAKAGALGLPKFSHGIAAKLINVYLKGAVVCGGHEWHENVMAMHPPIDSLLLDELYANDVAGLKKIWASARKQRWSKFSSSEYEAVIAGIRQAVGAAPMWQIEALWRGYQ